LLVAALPWFDAILTILRRSASGGMDPEASDAHVLSADGVAGGIRMACRHGQFQANDDNRDRSGGGPSAGCPVAWVTSPPGA
jgi:hypothetical protein